MSSPRVEFAIPNAANGRAKRINNACRRCRERKVKCSGVPPCKACVNRQEDCIIEPDDKKIVVSERYLTELKRRLDEKDSPARPAKRQQEATQAHLRIVDSHELPSQSSSISQRPGNNQTSPGASGCRSIANEHSKVRETSSCSSEVNDEEAESSTDRLFNPLSNGPSGFMTDIFGRSRFLGLTSTWAYSQQVLTMIKTHLGQVESPNILLHTDGGAFALDWPSIRPLGPLRMGQLPSLDFALYLLNTVKFRLGQMYHLFEESTFMVQLQAFYANGPVEEPNDRLWYVHYLLIMALGQALLSGFVQGKPSGSILVGRAVELLPDTFGLFEDPILAIEVLSCLALYLQSVDHRNSAYTYIGQALRIALSQGLHREMLVDEFRRADVQRRRSVWWTMYILDRKFSSLMGAPNSVHDEEITCSLPESSHNLHTAEALRVHVDLSRLLAKVHNSVYATDGKLGRSFLKNIQSVLREMAGLATALEGSFEVKFDNSGPISRVAATLNLYYHQCIVLATRPLLICLLKDILSNRQNSRPNTPKDISEPLKALLNASRESASKSLRILVALQSQRLLDIFLPFDLESTFSCTFVLAVMSAVPSLQVQDTEYIDISFTLLDDMISSGNKVAAHRKDDLEKLFSLLQLLRSEAQSNASVAIDSRLDPDDTARQNYSQSLTHGANFLPTTTNGLSPENMLSIAGLLDWGTNLESAGDNWLPENWLWTEYSGAPVAWNS